MRRQLEGSRAVAETVARCRPQVVPAYPISPQTHIVEALSVLVRRGELSPCEYLLVESEFAAMSACIGASAAGSRAYTATASQGLLYMAEALFNVSGLGLPVVMTVANRAVGAPINIWNDHSDTMSQRDAGWVQLYASSNQEAADLHVQAFLLAERLSLPVMVCMDGFVLTHAVEEVDVPDQETVDAFLPPFDARQRLDPAHPVTIGAMVGPEAFMEVRYLLQAKHARVLDELPRIAADFETAFGRPSGGLVQPYLSEDADVVLVAAGSVLGTAADVVDTLRAEGVRVGTLGISCFRPWPAEAVRDALAGARQVVVLEKAFSVGSGGIIGPDVRLALAGSDVEVVEVVAGLGGRPVTSTSLTRLLHDVREGRLPPGRLHFWELDAELVHRELARTGRSGPHAENMIRDVGAIGAGSH